MKALREWAVVGLLAVIAGGVWVQAQPPVDPSPGSHTVIPCPDTTDDGFYNPPQGWCDDPNTLD